MAKNINHVSHKKSKLKVNGMPQLPSADAIVEGEIAVNFGKGVETLSIKNESGDVVTFSSDHFYTEQKLGSAFTGENSAKTVTDIIEDNELVTATALNDLKENKLDVSAYTEPTEYWVSGTGENAVVLKNSSGVASGSLSVVEGRQSSATSIGAHAEGSVSVASGQYSHAEGQGSIASGNFSHAEGSGGARATGMGSHAEGSATNAAGDQSHAEGLGSTASGASSHAEGTSTKASGGSSHAEGNGTHANGDCSHTEGNVTYAFGSQSHAEGDHTLASGNTSHAEGQSAQAIGSSSHAEGSGTKASGETSHAEGNYTQANGSSSHAEGQYSQSNGNTSHAEGYYTKSDGDYSHAEGSYTSALTESSHAEGLYTKTEGLYSHAEGYMSIASGESSHAEGREGKALGSNSHAEGMQTKAIGMRSHAEGNGTSATSDSSHAEGQYTEANGDYSHAEGSLTIANNNSEHASGKYNVSNSASTEFGHSGNTLFSVGNGRYNSELDQIVRHNAFEIRQNGDIYIVNKDGNDVRLQDELGSGTVDQVLDNTTSASTNPVSSKAVYDAVTDNELVWTNAFVTLSGVTSAHTADTTIHLTSAEKGQLHTHSNKSALDAITGNVGTMAYENTNNYSSATEVNTALADKASTGDIANFFDDAKYELSAGTKHVINFYHGNTVRSTIDATDFIKDGMIDTVSAGTSGSTTVLVITWNTDAGKSQTIIDIGDIFEADNYYTKSETSGKTELSTAFDAKLDKTAFDTKIGSAFTGANSGVTITEYIEENELITSTALNDLQANKLDASAYTPTDLSNYYTKDETSGATELTTAFSAKANTATTLAGYGITDAYTKADLTGSTTTVVVAKASSAATAASANSVALSNVSDADDLKAIEALTETSGLLKKTAANTWTLDTTSYSSATEVNTALGLKLDKTDFDDKLGSGFTGANSGNTVTSVIVSNERVTASALNDLQANKLDATAYTPTDLSNYYTKSETSGASEISAALADKIASGDVVTAITSSNSGSTAPISVKVVAENELVVSTALNDLYERKLDASAYTPTDLTNYYTKSETSGASEISNALEGKVNTSEYATFSAETNTSINDLNGQSETIAAALNVLNERITQLEEQLSSLINN